MNKEQEHRIRLRRDFTRETGIMATDNIPAYADWLEKKLAKMTTCKYCHSANSISDDGYCYICHTNNHNDPIT